MATRKKPANPIRTGRDHAAIALAYANGVIAGEIPAGKWVRLAAQRHLNDLKASEDLKYPYYFEPDKGARVCRLVEHLPHTKGKWASHRELIVLEPWQCFLIVVGYGWLRRKTGKRRFRVFYWEIPRKNGKSLLAAALGIYMLTSDGEYGAEVYSGATTEKQAHQVWQPAKLMMTRAEKVRNVLGVSVHAKTIVVPYDMSKFEPLIGKPGDGASPSCAIVDEFHEHDTPALYDTMETGMGAREQPLMLVITTAGSNIAGPCYEKNDEVRKVLDGVVQNDELFGVIFGIDEKDDWASPSVLRKANPNFGVSVDEEFLLAQQRNAMLNPIQQAKFKTKHLNVWTSVYSGVINMQHWALCEDPMLDEDDLLGCDAWIAADLASKSDLCSEQRLYRKILNGRPHYYLFGRYWLPEDAVNEEGYNKAHYLKWVNQGYLIQTDGATVDFELITATILDDAKRINPHEAIFDPYNAVQMMQAVMNKGVTAVEFVQTPQNFAVPLDELTTAIKDGRFHHDGNPITTWCMSNMVARPAKKGLISPIKQKPHQKIDGAIAVIMAMSRAAAVDQQPEYQMMFLGGQ